MTKYDHVRFTAEVQDPAKPLGRDSVRAVFSAADGYAITREGDVLTLAYGDSVVDYPFSLVRDARRVVTFDPATFVPDPTPTARKGRAK